jgi:hypothetical protein
MSIAATTVMRWHPNRTLVRMGLTTTLNPVDSTFLGVLADYTTGSAAEEDMRSTTLPSDTMQDGSVLEVVAAGQFANNANNKRVRIYLGGTAIADHSNATAGGIGWRIHVFIVNNSNVQESVAFSSTDAPSTSTQQNQTTKTMTTSQILKVTGQGAAASDISLKLWIVRHAGRNTNI